MKKKSLKEDAFNILRLYSFNFLPLLICLAVIILNNSLYKESNFQILMPNFIYIFFYYYLIMRPEIFSCYYALALGIIKDILDMEVLGMNALIFIIFWGIITSQNKFITKSKPFVVIWVGFLFSLVLISVFSFLLNAFLLNVASQPMHIIFSRFLLTVCFYTPIHWLLDKFE